MQVPATSHSVLPSSGLAVLRLLFELSETCSKINPHPTHVTLIAHECSFIRIDNRYFYLGAFAPYRTNPPGEVPVQNTTGRFLFLP